MRLVHAAWCLPCLLGGAALAQAPATNESGFSPADAARVAATTYRVVNLGAGILSELPAINGRGQVAFSLFDAAGAHAWFYDGRAVRDIGTLGGANAYAVDLNDAGQVAGYADTAAGPNHAFRWSAAGGMTDLGAINGGPSSRAAALNRAGAVVGWSDIGSVLEPVHAFLWRPADGMIDLGNSLGDSLSLSTANAINDAGLIVGDATLGGARNDNHGYAWTRATGMVDLGTLAGGSYSYVVGLDAQGAVTGWADVPGGNNHAFHWTRAHGMHDLGTAGGVESFPLAMNSGGQMVGVINRQGGSQHAMSWTRARGMHDLGTLGGAQVGDSSRALSVNKWGQVAGWSNVAAAGEPSHAVLWNPGRGIVDLNRRVRRLPAGLKLESADAIGDSGAIVAETNAGLVLLKPLNAGGAKPGAVLGPIAADELVAAGAPFTVSASFADDDAAAAHSVSWAWGDGNAEAPLKAIESGGAGSASARHVYTRPGVYTVEAQVTDGAGNSASVSRRVVVVDPAGRYAAGVGSLGAPAGSIGKAPARGGKARFTFFAPLNAGASTSAATAAAAGDTATASASGQGAQPFLLFSTFGFGLRSTDFKAVALDAGAVRFEGSGRDHRGGAVHFSLLTAPGAGAAAGGRFALKVWHLDPVTHAQVVDYDTSAGNQAAASGALAEGRIAVQM